MPGAKSDFIWAALLQGQAALGRADLVRADERLHEALTRARTVNVVELELPALIAIATVEHQRGHREDAKARLGEVWDSAERGPYPIVQADAYNVLADIDRADGGETAAIDAATSAFEAAWCDGPPYSYHWGLERARSHLSALGAPEPELPPLDESTLEPMPDVELNPKDAHWVDPAELD